jgi:hypothetical protein
VLAAGCAESEPPPTQARDLGTEERPLLPTSSAWHEPGITKGSAEWHPFREPPALPTAGTAGEPSRPAEPKGGEFDAAAVENEIRALLREFNEKVAAGAALEERSEFFVQAQRPRLRQIAESIDGFRSKLHSLREAVKEKSPEGTALLDRVVQSVRSPDNEPLQIEGLVVESENAARAKQIAPPQAGVPESLREVRFQVEGEYWCIEFPAIEQMAAIVQGLQVTSQQLDVLTQGIRSGQIPPERLLAQLKPLEAMLPTSESATPAPSEASGGAERPQDGG